MRYVRSDESLLYAPVSGTVDADFVNAWLTDGRPSFPVQVTGTLNLTVTPAVPLNVDLIALHHHNVRDAATVTLGGSLSSTIDAEPPFADGIFPNIYRLLTTPVSVTTLVLGISGNTAPVITSLYAGLSRTLESPLRLGRVRNPAQPFAWETLLAPYDDGLSDPRRYQGNCVLTEDGLLDVEAWYQSTRRGTRPTLIVPDDSYNDAILAVFNYTATDLSSGEQSDGDALFEVAFEVTEIQRIRW